MEPIDYEEFIIANRADIDKDPLNYLLAFPIDDIEKNDIPKKISTVEMAKPEHEAEMMDLHVNECLRSYNSNYTCLAKNYERFSSFNLTQSRKNDLIKLAKSSKQQEFEVDIQNQTDFIENNLNTNQIITNSSHESSSINQTNKNSTINNNPLALKRSSFMLNDLEKLDADPILPHLFERIPIETIDKENEILRNKDRLESIFKYYPPQNEESLVENRISPEPLCEHQCNRVLVKCTNLKFDLDIEPFWATMALYDLKEKRKVSENFSFDLNPDSLKHMLNTNQTHQDLSTQAKSCILNITYPSHDLFLVIRIEKVLQQGDIGECAEPYVKAQQQSQSSIEKLQLNANQFCERLGKYRMPFVWTAINIMSILNNSTGNSNMNDPIYTSNATSSNTSNTNSNVTQKASSLDRRSAISTVNNSTKNQQSKQYESIRKPSSFKDDLNNAANKLNETQNNQSLTSSLNTFKPIAISINTFFKQESDKLSDEDLFRCLNDLKKSTTLIKKLKCLPGSLKMEFSPFNFDLTSPNNAYLNSLNNHFLLSPELQFIKFLNHTNTNSTHYHTNNINNNSQYLSMSQHNHLLPIKEVLEFPTHPVYEPNYSYRNLLYIYPLSINLCGANSNRSVGASSSSSGPVINSSSSSFLTSSARNIAIKVNFMKGEDGEHCALPVFFAKSSSTLEYCKEVFVNVVYHNKTPQYHDEIKIKLPALLSDSNYHLLFTFYHISCQNSKDQNQLENIIGYSWLPLKQQFQFETTVQFTNSAPPPQQPSATSNLAQQSNDNDIYQSTNKSQIGSATFINQVQMVKSGIYSLPISFEKLPQGYSSLNYSIYDTSSSNQQNNDVIFYGGEMNPQNINEQNAITNNVIDPKNMYQNDRFMLNNIVNVNTVISNIANSSVNMSSNNSSAQTSLNAATSGNSKSYFDVKLNLVSTIHTQDVYLERFISIANSTTSNNKNNSRNNLIETINYSDTAVLKQAILDLCFASLESLVKFLYIIFDKLLFIMINNQCLSIVCLEVIARLVQKITDFLSIQNDLHRRNKLLVQYVKYSCNLPLISIVSQKYFHDELLSELLSICQPRSKNLTQDQMAMRDLLLRNLWFFNELIIKSLGLSLDAKKKQFKVNNNFKPAMNQSINFYFTKQLSQKFLIDLKMMIKVLTHEILSLKLADSSEYTKNLNCSLAFFLNDLLSLIDRGYIFKKIDYFMRETNRIMSILVKKSNSKDSMNSILLLHSIQLDFMRIITSHEHFLTLNIPFFPDLNELMIYLSVKNNPNMKNKQFNSDNFTAPKLIIDSMEYYKRHYLAGSILRQLFKSLHSPSSHIQFKSVSLLRNILESHDIDPRLQNIKSKIAYMYFPFVNLIIHFIPFMSRINKSTLNSNNHNNINNKDNQEELTNVNNNNMDNIDLQICSLNSNGNGNTTSSDTVHQLDELKEMLNDMNEFHMECEELRFFIDDMDNIDNYILNTNDDIYDVDNLNINEIELENETEKITSTKHNNKRHSSFSSKKSNNLVQNTNISDDQDISSSDSNINKNKPICSCIYLLNKTNRAKKFDISYFSRETIQDLLICLAWILRNLDKQLLFFLFSKWPLTKINKILILIDLCVNVFEYKSTSWTNKFSNRKTNNNNPTKPVIVSTNNNIKKQLNPTSTSNSKFKTKIEDLLTGDLMKKSSKNNTSTSTTSTANNQNELLQNVVNAFASNLTNKNMNSETNDIDESVKSIIEGNLSTECLLIGLEIIDLITKIIQNQQQQQSIPTSHSPGCTSSIAGLNGLVSISNNYISTCIQCNNMENNLMPNLLTNIMRLLLNALNLEQSTISLTNLFSFERALVTKFPELLFEEDTEYCADMCMRLLRHSTSPLQIVRSQASASLYFMMRQNFDIGNNFSRVKMQVTMSLSTLVAGTKVHNNGLSTNIDFNNSSSILMNVFNVNCLKKSLKTILFYSENDMELKESSFPAQVKDLVLNLSTILSDTVKMREHNDDPEMLIDLMHRIANCYQNSPDMRLIWLQNMAHKHLQNQNLVEAGQCLVHAAALVAEYLSMIENRSYLPVGCASFKNVSVNVLEESAISDDVLSEPYEEGICSGKYFTETGLIGLIEQAAVFLMHSHNYEAANELYKILIPVFEANKDIKKLSQVYSKLHDCFNKILLNNNRRLFGTYFRVGFYGDKFEDLNGEEFIYKEPGITKLAEIAHRLENFYSQKFGQGCVEIMKDSNNVDKNNLNLATKAYIQITYVEPYFDRWEMQKCESVFDKNYSLKRFIYATPFTLDGKAHGPLNQQYKRKTILTTERAFPYVKTRIKVIDKQQVILGPVEVAIEDLQKKIDELKNATLQEPADPKILQMVLQGCVGTTVNQGPLEMALTFLQPVSFDVITEHHNKLRLCFKEFSRRCAEALKKNKNLIGPDQFEYQKEMEKNYNDLKMKINPLIENKMFKNNIPAVNSKGEH